MLNYQRLYMCIYNININVNAPGSSCLVLFTLQLSGDCSRTIHGHRDLYLNIEHHHDRSHGESMIYNLGFRHDHRNRQNMIGYKIMGLWFVVMG